MVHVIGWGCKTCVYKIVFVFFLFGKKKKQLFEAHMLHAFLGVWEIVNTIKRISKYYGTSMEM